MSENEDSWDEASLRQLLTMLGRCELTEELLLWGSQPDKLRISLLCNDVFWWATADAEEIRPEDVELVRQCHADLDAVQIPSGIEGRTISPTWWTAELYAARKRSMRPQGPWYGYPGRDGVRGRDYVDPQVEALFDACGPEREDSPKIPRPVEQ